MDQLKEQSESANVNSQTIDEASSTCKDVELFVHTRLDLSLFQSQLRYAAMFTQTLLTMKSKVTIAREAIFDKLGDHFGGEYESRGQYLKAMKGKRRDPFVICERASMMEGVLGVSSMFGASTVPGLAYMAIKSIVETIKWMIGSPKEKKARSSAACRLPLVFTEVPFRRLPLRPQLHETTGSKRSHDDNATPRVLETMRR